MFVFNESTAVKHVADGDEFVVDIFNQSELADREGHAVAAGRDQRHHAAEVVLRAVRERVQLVQG